MMILIGEIVLHAKEISSYSKIMRYDLTNNFIYFYFNISYIFSIIKDYVN